MTSLHDALDRLAPEPPDDLGQPATAFRRARVVRRRRAGGALVAASLVLGAATFAGIALPRDREAVPPASPLTGTFPEWPRRGDGDPSLDRAAVDAWTASLRGRATVVSAPRVLYAGDDRAPVVVMHATTYPGGDRVVAVTFAGGVPTVRSDMPAPLPGVGAFVVTFDPAREGAVTIDGDMCRKTPLDDPAHDSRDLVIAAPGAKRLLWRSDGFPPRTCGPDSPLVTDWRDVEHDDGVALVPVPLGEFNAISWRAVLADGGLYPTYGLPPTRDPVGYAPPRPVGTTLLGWAQRQDGTRAFDAYDRLCRRLLGGDPGCDPEWAQSLPDGTSAGLFSVARGSGPTNVEPCFYADDGPAGTFRVYCTPRGVVGVVAAVVQGRTGRWLLVVGPPGLEGATYVRGETSREVPLSHGTGFLPLGPGDAADGATLVTPEGTYEVQTPEGREVR